MSVAAIDAFVEGIGIDAVVSTLGSMIQPDRRARIEEVLSRRVSSITLVLENLFDPHNGAAVIRSAEAFGITELHVVETQSRFSASRGITLGSQKWICVARHRSVSAAAAAVRAAGMKLCAAVPGVSTTIDDLDIEQPWAVWFGNERDGLTAAALAVCDQTVSIPMYGFTRSLNLSVSVALCLADLVERRRHHLGQPGDLTEERRAALRARWYVQSVRGARQIVQRIVSKHPQSDVSPGLQNPPTL